MSEKNGQKHAKRSIDFESILVYFEQKHDYKLLGIGTWEMSV
jgi:hypothetical protein